MLAPYSPRIDMAGNEYFPPPYSATVLPRKIHHGLVAIGLLACLSVASTMTLIIFIAHRTWVPTIFLAHNKKEKPNQYVLLVLMLLVADLQQSTAFLISWYWYSIDSILAPTNACFAQGWLIHSGDVSSGFFVLAIALHTLYTAVYGRRVGAKTFWGIVAGIWIFAYTLTGVGVGMHGDKYFVRAGAWCWVSSHYPTDRLALHYIWVFLVEFGTVCIYLVTWFTLHRRSRKFSKLAFDANSPNAATIKKLNRVTLLMVLYPCVYILLTLPLSSGRMWSISHNEKPTSDAFSIVAGCLLTSCGWADSLLYTLTRRRLLQDTQSKTETIGYRYSMHAEQPFGGIMQTKTVTVDNNALDESDEWQQMDQLRATGGSRQARISPARSMDGAFGQDVFAPSGSTNQTIITSPASTMRST